MSPAQLHTGTGQGRKSSGVFAGRLPVRHARPTLDPYAARQMFPEVWARFLRETFGTSAAVAAAFRCDDRTARSWLNATNSPQGHVVALAAVQYPEFRELLGVAA
jgi:hypothetical protein